MAVYKIVTLIGTSTVSWEAAAAFAIQSAQKTLRGLRVAEVQQTDVQIGKDGSLTYRTKVKLSFEYEPSKDD
jgi:flavin-binding protein dodecin